MRRVFHMDNFTNKRISAAQLRVYFLGSGVIAVPVLRSLVNCEQIDLVGCGTQPDRAQGRKRRLTATPVGQFCEENGIEVDKPESANSSGFLAKLSTLCPDLILVFAFGQILRRKLLNLPRLACINLHASLLPRHRGAAPVNAAILAGDKVSGISVMKMTRGLDSGPVYKTDSVELTGSETALSLTEDLADLAAENVCDALMRIADGSLEPVPQLEDEVTYAGKIKKTDGQIHWTKSAIEIERMVRAYHPWPGAYFTLNNSRKTRRITVTQAAVVDGGLPHAPGQVVQADKHAWTVACGQDALSIQRLIPEGKKEMTASEFIRGCPIQSGIFLNETDCCQSREPANADCTGT